MLIPSIIELPLCQYYRSKLNLSAQLVGVISGGFAVVTLTALLVSDTFPAASFALIVYGKVILAVKLLSVYNDPNIGRFIMYI